MLGHI
jgi:hypothetical protein